MGDGQMSSDSDNFKATQSTGNQHRLQKWRDTILIEKEMLSQEDMSQTILGSLVPSKFFFVKSQSKCNFSII